MAPGTLLAAAVTGVSELPPQGATATVCDARTARAKVRAARLEHVAVLLKTGFGTIGFAALDSTQLPAYTYRSSRYDARVGPIWFVMHGAERNAQRYLRAAAPVAERYAALAVAIEFSKENYPTSGDYTLGVIERGRAGEFAFSQGRWRDPDQYLYGEVERVFDAVRRSLSGCQAGYYLFGHSAGAQFVHRLITFEPNPRVLGAVAANAGWYTLPTWGNGTRFAIPYALRGSPLTTRDLKRVLAAPLAVLLGSEDTATPAMDNLLRGTPEAMAQGANRFERGRRYFSMGQASARAHNLQFGWRLAEAPGAAHQMTEVIASAGFLLFDSSEQPCRAESSVGATSLSFARILVDPPRGKRGDANNDGVRDAAADEYVELVNTGPKTACLAGWTLHDATNRRRHLFPLGHALAPGKRLMIFGGGIPIGGFAGAEVQWASSARGLSLTNRGDVVTLRDSAGRVVRQVSWGDCGGVACASEHRS